MKDDVHSNAADELEAAAARRRRLSTRRSFLRGLGISAAAMPLLGGLSSLSQAQTTRQKRFIAVYSPNGMLYDQWRPTGGESDFVLSPILQPLERHRAKLLILDRLSIVIARRGPYGHQRGMGGLLTGQELIGGEGSVDNPGLGGGISIDQVLAPKLGDQPSLQLGVQVDKNYANRHVNKFISYAGAAKPLYPNDDPYDAFEKLFGNGVSGDDPQAVRRRALKKSVLDQVLADFNKLDTKLSGDDKLLLQSHAEALRSIEKRLSDNTVLTCKPVSLGTPIDTRKPENFPLVSDLMTDIMVQALACGLTNVVTYMWSYSETGMTYPWVGVNQQHHPMSHDRALALVKVDGWYMEQFAKMLDKLDAVKEAEGTLLDNSAVWMTNCLSNGSTHHSDNMPFVLAGSAGGYFRTGRCLRFDNGTTGDRSAAERSDSNPSNQDLIVSIANALGMPELQTFGNPETCRGPLPNLV